MSPVNTRIIKTDPLRGSELEWKRNLNLIFSTAHAPSILYEFMKQVNSIGTHNLSWKKKNKKTSPLLHLRPFSSLNGKTLNHEYFWPLMMRSGSHSFLISFFGDRIRIFKEKKSQEKLSNKFMHYILCSQLLLFEMIKVIPSHLHFTFRMQVIKEINE